MDRVKIIVTPHEISWKTNSNATYAEIDTMLRDATHEWEYERERHSKYEYNYATRPWARMVGFVGYLIDKFVRY